MNQIFIMLSGFQYGTLVFNIVLKVGTGGDSRASLTQFFLVDSCFLAYGGAK